MFLRFMVSLTLVFLTGCSADELSSPLKFFPGAERSSWSACDKFGATGGDVLVCATFIRDPIFNAPTAYTISFYVPRTLHVRIAVFDEHGAPVTVLLDQDEMATIGQFRTPPVIWNFTDARGVRVPRGAYRCYLSAGEDFLSFSDVEVP